MPQDAYVTPTIQASSSNLAHLKTGGLKIILDRLVAANPAKANPTTQATATATGGGASGGLLAAGTYYLSYSFVDAFGETTIGTSRSALLTVASTNIPRVTVPSLPTGVQSINLYATPAGGAAGSEVLYASGITSTTFDMAYAAKTDLNATLPESNTTGAAIDQLNAISGLYSGNAGNYLIALNEWVSSILSGAPAQEREIRRKLIQFTGTAKLYYTAWNELATLLWTNLGTAGYTVPSAGTGMAKPVRTLA